MIIQNKIFKHKIYERKDPVTVTGWRVSATQSSFARFLTTLVILLILINTGDVWGQCHQIGSGTSASSGGMKGGIYTYAFSKAYSQQLYLKSEFPEDACAGKIDSIAFRYAENTGCGLTFEVYLGQTEQTEITAADWIRDASLTLVYSGVYNFNEGWNYIDISSANYRWDGVKNIVVAIRRTETYPTGSTGKDFYIISPSINKAAYKASYPTLDTETNLPGPKWKPTDVTPHRPQMRFCINCCSMEASIFFTD